MKARDLSGYRREYDLIAALYAESGNTKFFQRRIVQFMADVLAYITHLERYAATKRWLSKAPSGRADGSFQQYLDEADELDAERARAEAFKPEVEALMLKMLEPERNDDGTN